jgi:hypothetical protein
MKGNSVLIRGSLETVRDTIVEIRRMRVSDRRRDNYGVEYWIMRGQKATYKAYEDEAGRIDQERMIGQEVKIVKYSKHNRVLSYEILD